MNAEEHVGGTWCKEVPRPRTITPSRTQLHRAGECVDAEASLDAIDNGSTSTTAMDAMPLVIDVRAC